MAGRGAVATDEQESVRAELPWGASITARGPGVVIAFIVALSTASIAFLVWQHDVGTKAALSAVQNSVEDLTYVMTLPQDKREQLQLTMPDSLAAKMRRRHGRPDRDGE